MASVLVIIRGGRIYLFNESVIFLYVLFCILRLHLFVLSLTDYMQGADCGNRKHLAGAVVYSHVRSDKQHEHYTHGIECQLTFQTEKTGWRLMLRVLDIDIPDMSRRGICNDALYVYDDETIFTRAMVSVFLCVCVCVFLMWDIQITPNTLVINEIPCH